MVTLTWKAPNGDAEVAGYNIFYDGDKIASTKQRKFTIEGLSPGTAYKYSIRAVGVGDELSPPSKEVSVTTSSLDAIDSAEPSAPINDDESVDPGEPRVSDLVTDVSGSDNSGSSTTGTAAVDGQTTIGKPLRVTARKVQPTMVTLTWKAPNGDAEVAGYNIFYDGDKIASTKQRKFTIEGLSPGTAYKYSIRAVGVGDELSPPSKEISVTTSSLDATDSAEPSV